MMDSAHTTTDDTLMILQDTSTETNEEITRPRRGPPVALFNINDNADLIDVSDYATSSLEAINELLDAGVLNGEMSGTNAWLIQQLIVTREAAIDRLFTAS